MKHYLPHDVFAKTLNVALQEKFKGLSGLRRATYRFEYENQSWKVYRSGITTFQFHRDLAHEDKEQGYTDVILCCDKDLDYTVSSGWDADVPRDLVENLVREFISQATPDSFVRQR